MADKTLQPLTDERCWELLASRDVGRLAVSVANRPDVFPVNYRVDGETILIRTAAGNKLAAATLGKGVAFEVDALNESVETGWSVVVQGQADVIERLDEWMHAEDLDIHTWVPGEKHRYIRIRPERVEGRRIADYTGSFAGPSCLTS